jgi:serine/threonine-protein kinase
VDNDERMALMGACQSRGFHHAAARLYADAFAADPGLADNLISACRSRIARGGVQPGNRVEELATQCRYPAARCAALAGCGRGEDGARLGEAVQTRWRRQAREWLRADLAMWAETLKGKSTAAHVLVRSVLTHWQTDPDLSGVRDTSLLANLAADERKDWLALWNEVAGVLERAKKAR